MLYHFSEDPSITRFVPRVNPSHPDQPPLVWAVDADHAPLYFFPRDCPRIAFWPVDTTSEEDRVRYRQETAARMVIAVESRWLERIQEARLFQYHFSAESFRCYDQGAGYYTSSETVTPLKVEPVDNLLQRLIDQQVELRVTPSLFPLRDSLQRSTLHFSMIRMRNAR
jgi:hypothetical protein